MLSIASLAACTVTLSRNPIRPLEDAIPTPELLGTWVGKGCKPGEPEPGQSIYLHVIPLRATDNKQFETVVAQMRSDGTKSVWFVVDGYATALRNGLFLNLRLRVAAAGPSDRLTTDNKAELQEWQEYPYFFASYEIYKAGSDRRLFIDFSIDEALGHAANNDLLSRDTPAEGEYGGKVLVTDSSANIAKYLGSLDEAALFGDQCVFRKLE